MHMKITKKHPTRGKIYYEIKYNFCVDTLNESCYEYNISLLKVKLLDWLKATVTSQKFWNISNYELKKMKVLMMWLVYVFGVPSDCFYTIFSIFSGNSVLKKKICIKSLGFMGYA